MPTVTLTKKTEQLFNELEQNTGVKKSQIINEVVNGKKTLKDLKEINRLAKIRKEPKRTFYTSEQMKKAIDNMKG
ncbi:MAG: hypothetical protein LBR43_03080 [Spiroplasmataceae bacterium]|jgi:hypothetical protein|nr:hypothetical protein [Spiroplasmataceae bacterium]